MKNKFLKFIDEKKILEHKVIIYPKLFFIFKFKKKIIYSLSLNFINFFLIV